MYLVLPILQEQELRLELDRSLHGTMHPNPEQLQSRMLQSSTSWVSQDRLLPETLLQMLRSRSEDQVQNPSQGRDILEKVPHNSLENLLPVLQQLQKVQEESMSSKRTMFLLSSRHLLVQVVYLHWQVQKSSVSSVTMDTAQLRLILQPQLLHLIRDLYLKVELFYMLVMLRQDAYKLHHQDLMDLSLIHI